MGGGHFFELAAHGEFEHFGFDAPGALEAPAASGQFFDEVFFNFVLRIEIPNVPVDDG